MADVTRAAFAGVPDGTDEEAQSARLGDGTLAIVALVAVEDGEIIGNIVFLEHEMVNSEHQQPIRVAALTSLAVAPTHQRLGIGSELVRQGLDKCRENGIDAVIVCGAAQFFARFGFSAQQSEFFKSAFFGQNTLLLTLK